MSASLTSGPVVQMFADIVTMKNHRISLVEKYLDNAAIAVDTIVHEVAHTRSQADHSHGEQFRAAKKEVMAAYEEIAASIVYRHRQRTPEFGK